MTDVDVILRELREEYWSRRTEILKRLEEFRQVPAHRYFYELCFCIMTPQSNAVHCYAAAEELERRRFLDNDFDPEPILSPSSSGYVRFHKTKAQRLIALKHQYPEIANMLALNLADKELRKQLAERVHGLGYKEASHFTRNIGRLDVTIVDRHILRNLVRMGKLIDYPTSISPKKYLSIEALFETLAKECGIPHWELDLLLWSRETGFILK